MTEAIRLSDPGMMIDEETLTANLQELEIKRAWRELYTDIPSTLGSHVPTRQEWLTRRPEHLGLDIRHAMQSGEAVLRIFALHNAGLVRREESQRRTGGICVRRVWGDGPLYGAEVTDVIHYAVGDRALPVLMLTEYGDARSNPSQKLAISVPDLAHYLQTEKAEIKLV
jgi:hypothetical protein